MTNQTHCPHCGYNFAAFGRVHRCIPRTGGGVLPAVNPVPLGADSRKPTAAGHRDEAAALAVDPAVSRHSAAGTYKYRDADKWRAYMRDYMRRRRGVSPRAEG